MAKYLDSSGLSQLWTACKNTFLTTGSGDERYLKLSGGTLTGTLTMTGQKIVLGAAGAIVFHTSTATDWSSPQNSGIRILNTAGYSRDGAPTNYSVGLSVQGYYGFQLACCNADNDFRMRSTSAGSNNYDPEPWVTLLHSGNYSTYCAAASHTHSYLPLSGGTMTGAITMGNGARRFVLGPNVSFVADFSADTGGWADTLLGVKDKDGIKTLISCYGSNSSGLNYGTLGGVWNDPAARIYMDGFEVLKSRSITPSANNSYYCGGNSYKWAAVYSNQFIKDTNSTNILLANGNTLAQSTFAGSSHNHDSTYLKLSGGTMAGDIVVTDMNKGIRYKVNYLAGWARSFITFYQHTDSDSSKEIEGVWGIGTYGDVDGYRYTYIGGDEYSGEKNLRFYKNGDIKIGSNIIYHAGNLPAYPTLSSLGAAAVNHNHNGTYLPLSGGTLSGDLTIGSKLLFTNSSIDDGTWPSGIWRTSNGFQIAAANNGSRIPITLGWRNDSNMAIYIDTDAKVGIGTSSPSEKLEVNGNIKADSFIKKNGTSSQFLKADGSVDSSSYSLSSHTHSYLFTAQVSTPQDSTYGDSMVSWAEGYAEAHPASYVYNSYGAEYSYLVGLNSNTSYGTILKIGYSDKYLRILRKSGGTWQSNDWEKISAGYADSAGSVAWSGVSSKPDTATRWPAWSEVTGKPDTFTPASHSHSYLPLSGGTMGGNINNNGEYTYVGYMPRKKVGGGGWAYDIIACRDPENTRFMHFGVFGDEAACQYIYLGSGEWNSTNNLRISSSGVSWGTNTIYHSGNLPAYPTKASWNYDDVYLKLSGGSLTGSLSVTGSVTVSDKFIFPHGGNGYDWSRINEGYNRTSIRAYCTAGEEATGARDKYTIGLMVDGYYSFALGAYGGGAYLAWRDCSGTWRDIIHAGNYTSYCATSDHNHDSTYLKLSGGTMTGNISLSGENYISYSPAAWGSAWARMPFKLTKGSTTIGIGGYGDSGSTLNYMWFGSSYDSDKAIKVFSSSDPQVGSNTILHAGNHTSLTNSEIDAIII